MLDVVFIDSMDQQIHSVRHAIEFQVLKSDLVTRVCLRKEVTLSEWYFCSFVN